MFAKELNRRCAAANLNIKAFSLHPGVIQTELARHQSFGAIIGIFSLFLKSIPQGAATTIYCATAPEAEEKAGEYFLDCHYQAVGVPQALDAEFAKTFFDESLKMTNTTFKE